MGIGKLAINEDPRPQRDTPLYVIGYPGLANKTVADNAHIFAGFDTSDDEKTGFELEARNEAARMVLKANERNKDKNRQRTEPDGSTCRASRERDDGKL